MVSQMWYPAWRAEVDGRSAPVLRVWGALQGVVLEPGRHQVRLHYPSGRLGLGLALAGAGALGLIALLAWDRRRTAGQSPATEVSSSRNQEERG